jgi:thermitase
LVMRYEYAVSGEVVSLDSSDDLVAVRFRPEARPARRAAAMAAANVRYPDRVDVIEEGLSIVRVPAIRGALSGHAAVATSVLGAAAEVACVSPVFQVQGGVAVAAQRVLLAFSDPRDAGVWLKTGAPGRSLVRCTDGQGQGGAATLLLACDEDPLKVARDLAMDSRLRYAEPAFVNVLSKPRAEAASKILERAPTWLYEGQYAMRLTRAVDAWQLQRGSMDVRVAVLDEGVDTLHADLPVVARGFDATARDAEQEPNPWDNHGTACAGLAVAHGNHGTGIVGAGNGCGLMSARIAGSPFPGADWQTANENIADAVTWAWQNGASVLSNSWVGGAPSNRIAEAFEDARRKGRGGLGCVLVVAAGNGEGPVQFPGTLPGVLTVAASNEHDEPKTLISADGEPWGSSYGPQVDLAAPGVHHVTTDNLGPGGNISGMVEANYVDSFNGTSAATPIVAGAAALVLSANPSLTEAEVRAILRETAAKVGAVPYVEGRNDRMGYGRLDVLAAVAQAQMELAGRNSMAAPRWDVAGGRDLGGSPR